MRYLFILLFSFSIFAGTSSPRDTMETFLKPMVQIKKQNLNHELYYNQAISTLDLSEFNDNIKFSVGKKYSNSLIFVLDRMQKIEYSDIPDKVEGSIWYFDKTRDDLGNIKEISIGKVKDKWLFTKATLQSLKFYTQKYRDSEVAGDVVESHFENYIRSKVPASFQEKGFIFEHWQWLGFIALFLIAFILERIIGFIAEVIVNKYVKVFKVNSSDLLENALVPFRRLVFVILLIPGITYLDLPVNALSFLNRILLIIISFFTVWLGHRIIHMLSYYFQARSAVTDSKFDDILIPLLTKTTFVLLYIMGAMYIAYSFTIDITGVIAGLGIGGLAFAFAAKDTLANFFGSIMLILDRPFDIGDSILTGDIEGTVVEVGFRSTKVRTFYDSIISVPNGNLANVAIDNKGRRRYRRLNTTLGIEYDTPPEKVEAFCEGIRQIVLNHKWTRKDNFNIYFVNFGASALEIQLQVFWETPEYAREQAEKHRLMIDILRLANDMDINFAFPTQTVHLFNEGAKKEQTVDSEYFNYGIEKAKQVITKPLSLKNPRSNAGDKSQFGENDFGID